LFNVTLIRSLPCVTQLWNSGADRFATSLWRKPPYVAW
jgi:hypothetical protein